MPRRLLCCLYLVALVSGLWVDDASDSFSAIALNITQQFVFNQSSCLRVEARDWASLESSYRKEASEILQRLAPSLLSQEQNQVSLRMQQDPVAGAAQDHYYRTKFNGRGFGITVSIIPTPPFSNNSINFTAVTLPADTRWADVSGMGSDSIGAPDRTVLFHPFLMFYRTDLLEARNMSVPRTWEGLLAAAKALNGTDLDGDGEPEAALCFNPNYHCQQAYMLLAVFASMIQTLPKGHPQYSGVWFDRSTMEPTVDNAAMQRALQVYAELAKYNHPVAPDVCMPHSEAFSQGKCAFAFNMEQYRLADMETSPRIYGKLGTSLCPGSPYVLEPSSNTLVLCNATLCPLSYAPPDPSRGPRINRAPLNLAIRTFFIESKATTVEALAARYTFFQYALMDWASKYVGPLLTALDIRSNDSLMQPAPSAQPAPSVSPLPPSATNSSPAPAPRLPAAPGAPGNSSGGRRMLKNHEPGEPPDGAVGTSASGWRYDAKPLLARGYHLADTVSFLKAVAAVWSHNNTALDIFIPGSAYFRLALAEAATKATAVKPDLHAITATLASQFLQVKAKYEGTESLEALYTSCMGVLLPRPPLGATTGDAAAPSARQSASDRRVAYIAAVVTVVAAAAILVFALLLVRARVQGRSLLGSVIAPLAGASTTLLVTDIQNSTVMWEQMPMALMEEVLRVHHATLRGLLDKHRGYESATEGDSFILAFHSPKDALEYAVEAQQALLAANWPQQLLDTFPEAAVVSSTPVKGNSDAELSYVIRRLQGAEPPHSLVHMSTFRSPSFIRNPPPPRSSSRGHVQRQVGAAFAAALRSRASKGMRQLWQGGRFLLLGMRTHYSERGAGVPSMQTATDGEGEDVGAGSEAVSGSIAAAHTASKGCVFGWALSQAWVQSDGNDVPPRTGTAVGAAPTLTWRGVRVRVGIHSGLADPLQVAYNKASRRTQYTGVFADGAKRVADSAHGGQILLSEAAFSQLKAEDRAAGLIMCIGEYELGGQHKAAVPLYQVASRALAARLPCFPALRAARTPLAGVLEAPVGTASIVFMKATGVAMLTAWNSCITKAALQLYHTTVCELIPKYSGYIVEMAEELSLAAFQRPEAAIGWALAAQAALLAADWPRALLEHELCEPITTTMVASAAPDSSQLVHSLAVHSRGLRLKVGVAQGRVVDSVNEATGHMAYRGKVMNRAARIASAASTGQVLVHHEAWGQAAHSRLAAEEGITATSTGLHALKGILHPTELFSCTYISEGIPFDHEAPLEQQRHSGTRRRSRQGELC